MMRRTLPLLASLVWILATPSWAARIVVFGDSWGVPAAPALQQVLDNEGIAETVANAAVGGDTAANLATNLGFITSTLAANPDSDLIHLSIGGNDFLGAWHAGLSPAQQDALFAAIITDTQTIVNHILSARPNANILWSSYDTPRPLASGTPTQVNAAAAEMTVAAQALADATAGLTYGDFGGLMQVTYGFDGVQYTSYDPASPIAPGSPLLPDFTLPGPYDAYIDQIHLTSAGYAVLAQAQYDFFYEAFLVPEPSSLWLIAAGLAALYARRAA
ncbi:MAG: PEP-CTERM sorting domain-containing protein [bacterium]|nr:PEP-CTERM sorting domain-containing protein [bacterium]MCP5067718.1 PEP-CTERM sorting domain-containing protein [bacterium]